MSSHQGTLQNAVPCAPASAAASICLTLHFRVKESLQNEELTLQGKGSLELEASI